MARIIQIIDVSSDGHLVRLDNGEKALIHHGHGQDLQVGQYVDLALAPLQVPDLPPDLTNVFQPEEPIASIEPSTATSDGDCGAQPGEGSEAQ